MGPEIVAKKTSVTTYYTEMEPHHMDCGWWSRHDAPNKERRAVRRPSNPNEQPLEMDDGGAAIDPSAPPSPAHAVELRPFVLVGGRGSQWTSMMFPDLRGPTVSQCLAVLPRNKQQLYVCDPDHILNNTQAMQLNLMLQELAVGTPCHCQRRSQCTSGSAGSGSEGLHGFVVSVAIVRNLHMQMHSPSEAQLTERAELFCRALEGRWALGDCGNSIIIFVWQHYKKLVIWPARLAERYVTSAERKAIISKVNEFAQVDNWFQALSIIIKELSNELNGVPEDKFDTGTLSLLISIAVAVFLTIFITCCVCAFRCCGNVRQDRRKSVERAVDTLRASVIRRSGQLRRSISRSPKTVNPTRFFPSSDATAV
ncbi:unnamed protein product [Caenorhabditis auriculariae]|uniref:Uncharacterized protein n=1 Tax=Caenorhabditis auriculariae TaxID=2777116 RepID=A0A8S1GYX9_9PELO|nr:unnamed protein product [Caenorhabditis auriculariae]